MRHSILYFKDCSFFGSGERNRGGDDAMTSNSFLPVAPVPDWLLPRRQQQEPQSEQRQTQALGPEGHG